MNQPSLKPRPLTATDFAAFGDVLAASGQPKTINHGNTLRFDMGAALTLHAHNGCAGISVFRSTPLPAPIQIEVMERHPLSSQAFYPLSGRPFLVVVAPRGDLDPAGIRAFIAGPGQGVNYHPGVWHHYLLALEDRSDFLVIDRLGDGENCDEVYLPEPLVVELA